VAQVHFRATAKLPARKEWSGSVDRSFEVVWTSLVSRGAPMQGCSSCGVEVSCDVGRGRVICGKGDLQNGGESCILATARKPKRMFIVSS
jgi:hypothetical protein